MTAEINNNLHGTSRYNFADAKQSELMIKLGKGLDSKFFNNNGLVAQKLLKQINQCQRIIDYYQWFYLRHTNQLPPYKFTNYSTPLPIKNK